MCSQPPTLAMQIVEWKPSKSVDCLYINSKLKLNKPQKVSCWLTKALKELWAVIFTTTDTQGRSSIAIAGVSYGIEICYEWSCELQ